MAKFLCALNQLLCLEILFSSVFQLSCWIIATVHILFLVSVCFELYFAMIIPKINTFVQFIIYLSWYGQFVFFDFRLA